MRYTTDTCELLDRIGSMLNKNPKYIERYVEALRTLLENEVDFDSEMGEFLLANARMGIEYSVDTVATPSRISANDQPNTVTISETMYRLDLVGDGGLVVIGDIGVWEDYGEINENVFFTTDGKFIKKEIG